MHLNPSSSALTLVQDGHCYITEQVSVQARPSARNPSHGSPSVVAYSTLQLTYLLIVGIVTQGLGI